MQVHHYCGFSFLVYESCNVWMFRLSFDESETYGGKTAEEAIAEAQKRIQDLISDSDEASK